MGNLIKRPLIFILGAYLSGLLLSWFRISLAAILFLIIIAGLILYLFMFRIHNRYISRKDLFLWSLPLLLLLGYLAMGERIRPLELEAAFEEEAFCTLTGRISMVAEKPKGRAIYLKNNVVILSSHKQYQVENIIVNCSDNQKYIPGNKINVSGKIQKFSVDTNPGQFNEKMYYKIQNIDYKVKADKIIITDSGFHNFKYLMDSIKQRLLNIYRAILPDKEAGTLIAMLLGEKYLLDDEIKKLYQENGISHILAISGLHVSLIGISIYTLLRKLRAGLIPSTVISIILIYSYGILTNFSVSTNRAVVMFVIMLLAKVFGKTYDMLSAASLSAFLILLQNPLQIFHVGFLLSFGAVIGIAVILPRLRALFPTKNTIINIIFVSISAQIFTLPMVLYFYFQLPVYSIFINLIILPCMTVLVLSSLAAGIAGIISRQLGIFLIGSANYILQFYEGICRFGSSLPGNLFTVGKPDIIRMLLYFTLISLFAWSVGKYQKKSLIIVPLLAFFLLVFPNINAGLTVTMLDVGQGEAIYMKSGTGNTYLVDGGSVDINKAGTYRLQPFLLSGGVDCIDYAIVTHTDEDHISGLIELLEGNRITIRNLVLPDIGVSNSSQSGHSLASDIVTKKSNLQDKSMRNSSLQNTEIIDGDLQDTALENDPYTALQALANKKGVTVTYIKAGDRIQDGKLKITCLHPYKGFPYSSSNAYSTVLSVSYGEFDMLLTGDLQQDGEKLIMDKFLTLNEDNKYQIATDYDILKVAHHGSKSSTMMEFLQIIKPEYSLISCGKDNFYGHPHKELLSRLKKINSNIMITYESGAITVKTDGKKMEIHKYKNY